MMSAVWREDGDTHGIVNDCANGDTSLFLAGTGYTSGEMYIKIYPLAKLVGHLATGLIKMIGVPWGVVHDENSSDEWHDEDEQDHPVGTPLRPFAYDINFISVTSQPYP